VPTTQTSRPLPRLLATALLSLALTACGGGDDAPGLAAKVLARLYYQCVYEWHAYLPGHVRTCACLLTPCHRQMLIFLSRTVMHTMMLLMPLLVLHACSWKLAPLPPELLVAYGSNLK
jgi:predicted small lipoprotein YifL